MEGFQPVNESKKVIWGSHHASVRGLMRNLIRVELGCKHAEERVVFRCISIGHAMNFEHKCSSICASMNSVINPLFSRKLIRGAKELIGRNGH